MLFDISAALLVLSAFLSFWNGFHEWPFLLIAGILMYIAGQIREMNKKRG